jgi:hypothetical protein
MRRAALIAAALSAAGAVAAFGWLLWAVTASEEWVRNQGVDNPDDCPDWVRDPHY